MLSACSELKKIIDRIKQPTAGEEKIGIARLNSLTKPRGSLGRLEEAALKIWQIQGRIPLQVDPARVYTVAGDHGVVEEGISLYPQEVTRQMVLNFLNNGAAINVLCRLGNIEHFVVDAGCAGEKFPAHPQLIDHRICSGSANFTKGPALSEEECLACLQLGINLADEAAKQGIHCLGIGEMGIGNTTSSAALFAAYFNLPPEKVTGKGAGIPLGGLQCKNEVLQQALRVNKAAVDSADPFLILAALGGLEIAVMAGLILGGSCHNMIIAVDGFISTAAYVAAWKLCPAVREYCVFSHVSDESGHSLILSLINEKPLLDLSLRLGEGTGSALGIYLLRCAAGLFNDMATFDMAGIISH